VEKFGPNWTEFYNILYYGYLLNIVDQIYILIRPEKNIRDLA
jgi:hypothetical protein